MFAGKGCVMYRFIVTIFAFLCIAGGVLAEDSDAGWQPEVQGVTVSADLSIATGAPGKLASGAVSSAIIDMPLDDPEPFVAVTLRWKADDGITEVLAFYVRGEIDGEWTQWRQIELDDDLPPDFPYVQGTLMLYDNKLERLEFRAEAAPGFVIDDAEPVSVEAIFISPGKTPDTVLTGLAKQSAEGTKFITRPPVVSRTDWGCPDGQESQWNPSYTTVTHLVVHHTVNENTSSDWPAVVRSIWHLHTYTNDWGDVGYNYLVDANGVIYEGRAGGDNVIGAHFSGHNSNSMGVSIMGTYITVLPTDEALNSLQNILAWKANREGIDPEGVSLHAASGLTIPNICGHRDGKSPTECPGQMLYDYLPTVREKVAAIGGSEALDAPELILPADFTRNYSMPPEFTWDPVADATAYEIVVATSKTNWSNVDGFDFSKIVYSSGMISGDGALAYTWDGAEPGKQYYWTVRAYNDTQSGFCAEPRYVLTTLYPPMTHQPVVAVEGDAAEVSFAWNSVPNAKEYTIEVSKAVDDYTDTDGFPDPVFTDSVKDTLVVWADAVPGERYWWSVKCSNRYGAASVFGEYDEFLAEETQTDVADETPIPFALEQNTPNPFNPMTTIGFSLPEEDYVRLTVYNTAGQQVAVLEDGAMQAGSHTVTWDAAGRPSGIYLYRLEAGKHTATQKMLLLR